MTAAALADRVVAAAERAARLRDVSLSYGKTMALDAINLDIPSGCMVGLIGPDGVGKSSLLSLIAGAHAIQSGDVEVLGGNMHDARHRRLTCPRIAYMPQGLGKNLDQTLSVRENVDFFGRLFGHTREERERRIALLLRATALERFADRPAGKLSGGMKQKLGLCCALIHDPDLLILDEPTTGVDPLSRRQFWDLIDRIRAERPGMSVVVATAYMEEAARFDWLVAMDAGRVLATGNPDEFLSRTGAATLDAAFIALLPEEKRKGHVAVEITPRPATAGADIAIEAKELTRRFGDFTAVDHVNFRIERGEIFGFLGSNGCGKTTTMKVMTGLLAPTEGTVTLFGEAMDANDIELRRRVGYMSQSFSLYTELTVRQNLELHARLFRLAPRIIPARVAGAAARFGLGAVMDALPGALPLGIRQRLSLAVAMIHSPEILILDEPTSGVDPVARDALWRILIELSRRDRVTIFISTHFMNEAERCDRISLMHAGKVLVSDTPRNLVAQRNTATLEDAFISWLEEATGESGEQQALPTTVSDAASGRGEPPPRALSAFDPPRMGAYLLREALQLSRDPMRITLGLLGSLILMCVMAYGLNLDVDNLSFAVLDRDQTIASQNYVLNLAGSRYFVEHAPITSNSELERRMQSGEISLAIEIPPGFGRDIARGRDVAIGMWIDGAMPIRAETIRGYVELMHFEWLQEQARRLLGKRAPGQVKIEIRYRYNPGIESLIAMVPAMIPLLLLMIPAILATLAVVREKELGSIVNFYVTPVTRLEFLIGKQLPYIVLSMVNFFILAVFAVLVFGVPFTGSFATFTLAALLYVTITTGIGLLVSTFLRSQIAAITATILITMIPALHYSGMIDPVSSLSGTGYLIGRVFPTTFFMTIARGTFSKALGFADVQGALLPLAITVPILAGLTILLLKKQEA